MNTIKIRKNASKKIASFIAEATYITIQTSSSNMDDSFSKNADVAMTAEEVNAFMAANYNELEVKLHADSEGNNTHLTLRDGPYYFCDEVVVHFTAKPVELIEITVIEAEPVKFKMTLAQVKVMREAGFISPLSHGAKRPENVADEDKEIVSIKVIWSESSVFNKALRSESFDINQRVSMEEYNRLSWLTLANQKRFMAKTNESYGYDKTKIEITLASGQVCTFRHDICIKEPTLQGEWAAWVDYCRAEEARKQAIIH
ncbi:hypothetical protein JK628_02785 [Shewanella sp. KX20019]|uniref:LPD25 domain-containing protein n=1 Tax=Shewanella sp. KX20019 TaxID=2803864 RepID=UPI001925CA1D|nr:hypothetical protein [Shewanella sp. KX20019]QQX80815.1 hypothetical protein JK628_02785 [Shewanella sp. KX20019]